MAMRIERDERLIKFEKIVIDFIKNSGGYILVYTKDTTFAKVIRHALLKQLSIKEDCLSVTHDTSTIYKTIKEKDKNNQKVILFIERIFDGKSTNEVIKYIKSQFDSVYVVVLTNEVHRDILVNLHELGIDNIITKPVTMNTIVEKIAFTVKPQGKLASLIEKAKSLIAEERYDEAMQETETILSIKPNSAAAFMLRGDIYRNQEMKNEAVEEYKKAHSAEKLYLEPIKKLSQYYEELGEINELLELLKKLDQLSPLNVDRKLKIGNICIKTGDTEEAESYFDQALKVTMKEARENIKNIALEIAESIITSDPQKAEKYFRQALEAKKEVLDQSDIYTFNRLGIALRKQKKPKEAITEYKRALKLAPNDENLYYNLAMAYIEGKEFELSRSAINRALKINSNFYAGNAVLAYNIGMIYLKNRDKVNANSFFRKALDFNPNYEPARKMLSSTDS
jgi:tetratricopeptide (TPR) repeat protein